MHKWVQSELKKYIEKGIIKYIHTTKPTKFSQAITKNIVSKHGLCDIVSLVDADNELTPLYVETLLRYYNQNVDINNNSFANNQHLLVHAASRPHVSGRITFWKKDLLEIGGFDESMTGWGFEEIDFMKRHQKYFRQPRRWLVKKQYKQSKEFITSLFGCNHLRIPTTSRPEPRRNRENKKISGENIKNNILVANTGKEWGKL